MLLRIPGSIMPSLSLACQVQWLPGSTEALKTASAPLQPHPHPGQVLVSSTKREIKHRPLLHSTDCEGLRNISCPPWKAVGHEMQGRFGMSSLGMSRSRL